MNRRRFITLSGTFAALAPLACRSRSASKILKVSAHPFFSMSSLYLAQELGFFANSGLQIQIERTASAAQAIPLAAGGKLDVVFSGASASLINAIAKGSRLRIVAGREVAKPGCSDLTTVFGRREIFPDGITTVSQLRGKKVATDINLGLDHFGVDMLFANTGITAEEIGLITISRSELIVALLSGQVDAIIISDSAMRLQPLADRIVRGISLADAWPNQQVSYILFGSRLLDDDPESGMKFLSAYFRGTKEFLSGTTPSFTRELAISNGIDPEVARKACRDTFAPGGQIDLPSLERFIQWAQKEGYCPVVIKPEQLIDTRFLKGQKTRPGERE